MSKRTQVYSYHEKNGHLVDYAGYQLPVWFEGIVPECRTVRTKVGLFDVSHMGRVTVEGKNAETFLNSLASNDVSLLGVGQGHYSLLCNPEGGIIDDLTVFRTHNEKYLVVYNAANREKNWQWMQDHRKADVVLNDLSDDSAMFAVQGPRASELLYEISKTRLEEIDRYSGRDVKVGNLTCFLTRTGYTGEDGFEIYVWKTSADRPEHAISVWDRILAAGGNYGIKPVGLGARDVLRLEAGMCLYGNDIDDKTSPVEARLNFVVRLDKKGGFVGQDAIQQLKERGPSRVRAGFKMIERGIPRQGQEIDEQEAKVGMVSSGTLSPTLGMGVGMGYVTPIESKQGSRFQVRIRDRAVVAEVVKLPFYQRRSDDRVVVMGEEMGVHEFRTRYGQVEQLMAPS